MVPLSEDKVKDTKKTIQHIESEYMNYTELIVWPTVMDDGCEDRSSVFCDIMDDEY